MSPEVGVVGSETVDIHYFLSSILRIFLSRVWWSTVSNKIISNLVDPDINPTSFLGGRRGTRNQILGLNASATPMSQLFMNHYHCLNNCLIVCTDVFIQRGGYSEIGWSTLNRLHEPVTLKAPSTQDSSLHWHDISCGRPKNQLAHLAEYIVIRRMAPDDRLNYGP
ncbi:hypothetical protein BJ165DRAFT_436709 [Panaeolus papilionaceus]|nr:hypothetical protein BJ165DRAFT_436709 [Panaeolus papilionaceus]